MLSELCAELKNYFLAHDTEDIHAGSYTIADGSIGELPFLQAGQYYRIVGSVFNDGVHKYADANETLTDETFDGAVWAMSVPPAVIALDGEIDAWKTANAKALNSPFQSESFGGYTYSLQSGGAGSGSYGWQDQFRSRLNFWRRLHV